MNRVTFRVTTFILSLCICCSAFCQHKGKTFFVEGFHGGVYGHYPLKSYTAYMMDLLDGNPGWKFSIEIEPETWDSVRVADPVGYARLRDEVVRNGRVEITNPTYAQPYCYNISGESIIRQFEYGIRKLEKHFPGIEFDSYAVEEPCFTSALPQILRGFGIRFASIKSPNTTWGGYTAPHGGELVRWISPDGSCVLASPRHAIEELGKTVWDTKANGLYASYFEDAFSSGFKHPVGMCYQDAGWTHGLWLEYNDSPYKNSEYVTWREFFENIAKDTAPEDYEYHQEDMRPGLVWGSQVLQKLAQDVREGENCITAAEKMAVIANVENGYRYNQEDVDEAWRCLLLSQHHDSWIVPYNNLKNKGTWADWISGTWTAATDRIAHRVISQAQMSMLPGKRAKSGDMVIRVYNTEGVPRREVVSMRANQIPAGSTVVLKDSSGKEVESWFGVVEGESRLVFMADVPAFGYASYKVVRKEAGTAVFSPTDVTSIENDMYCIRFNPEKGGTIRSIYSKLHGYEVVSTDDVLFGQMKGYFCKEGAYHSSADSPATVRLVEDNPLEKKVRIFGTIASHPFIQTVTLRKGDPKISISVTIDWQGSPYIGSYAQDALGAYGARKRSFYDESGKLNIYFPSSSGKGKLFKNAPFDVCESRLDSTRFDNYDNLQHNVILNWADLEGDDGKSLALLSDHTTAYTNGAGRPFGLTLQFSGSGLWGRDYEITGPTNVSMALIPHCGDWKCVEKEDRNWNGPLLAVLSTGAKIRNRSIMNLGESGYEICAAHLTGDGILVRIYNASGDVSPKVISLDGAFSRAIELDLKGRRVANVNLDKNEEGKAMSVSIPRFGFKTYLLTRQD